MSLILTKPAVPTPITTAPNMAGLGKDNGEIEGQTEGNGEIEGQTGGNGEERGPTGVGEDDREMG